MRINYQHRYPSARIYALNVVTEKRAISQNTITKNVNIPQRSLGEQGRTRS